MKLGKRLAAIASKVPQGSRLGDIGTDHAYLPIYLVRHNIISYAIAGDLHQGPYLSAQKAVQDAGLEKFISVRQGDGLNVIKPGEVDAIVIAGMGGANIINILTSRPDVTGTVTRMILQPMIAAAPVRRWLTENRWRITDETLAEDEGKTYQIIVTEQGETQPLDPIFYEIGPVLWNSKHPLLKQLIAEILIHYKEIIIAMSGSPAAAASPKYQELIAKMKALEEKLICL
ncbi:MAG TPA: class I SAM-dependent methyltransferase [Methylomusa anaerophila]|uniref:tRNA (Adenine(22)-N(1))-methyltransferase n=1 Tax=Methylomusa anaerophila TaxID=1930071 RepID=A0A348AP09_9FIRM|nr:class I SAM-dependent methyltransferase [Methylomusa anaerophila]BBB92807.1 tRNA (adenine(22)-N(1))-methyltransferase [Methylomusa anaerophila]HML90719.1 class I SAM-dependent methyltransferase [Methylomusa anaerophila]